MKSKTQVTKLRPNTHIFQNKDKTTFSHFLSNQTVIMSSIIILLVSVISLLLLKPCNSTTTLVDGLSHWKNPNVVVGDSIIFRVKNEYKLYIFQNQRAFNLCNLTQASLLTKHNSTSYVWNPSRPGFFYFTMNNGSKDCEESQKMAVKVSPKSSLAPSPESASSPATMTIVPDKGGDIQFINSNPAVPLPTDEVDSATIRPVSTSSLASKIERKILLPAQVALLGIVYLL